MTLDQWNKVIETNLTGTFLFSQAVGKVMIAQRRAGKIINIASSVAGLRGSPPSFLRHRLQRLAKACDHFHERLGVQVGAWHTTSR